MAGSVASSVGAFVFIWGSVGASPYLRISAPVAELPLVDGETINRGLRWRTMIGPRARVSHAFA